MTTSTLTGAGTRRGRVFLAVATAALFLGVTALLVGASAAPAAAAAPPTGPPTADPATAAGHGAAWLAGLVDAGLPLQNFGLPDWGATLDAGLAFTWAGVEGGRADAVLAAVSTNRETVVAPGGVDNPGRLAKMVLLEALRGGDPRAVGAAPGADLVERLLATVRTSGPDAGLAGASDPTYDGVFRQSLAVLALRRVGVAPPPALLTWLAAQQCDDGSWAAYRSDLTAPCVSDPRAYSGPDSNSTALAMAAAAVSGRAEAASLAATWLQSARNEDGGWGYYPFDPAFPTEQSTLTDPNSTALVLQAAVTAGSVAAGLRDRATGVLLADQLGCDAAVVDRGGIAGPFSNGAADLLATVQAVPALAGSGFLAVADPTAGPALPPDCRPPTTTTTTSTTSTTTSTTSATTTTVPGPSSTTSTVPLPTTTATGPSVTVAGATVTASVTSGSSGSPGTTSSTAGLALTGGPVAGPVLVALLLVGLGSGLLAGRRRWV